MPRESLGEFEHQVLLAILQLGGSAYSAPIVMEMENRLSGPCTQTCGATTEVRFRRALGEVDVGPWNPGGLHRP